MASCWLSCRGLRSKWAGPKDSVATKHETADGRGSWYGRVNHPLAMMLHKKNRHPNPGCSPVKQHNMFTAIPLASPLPREDLRSIVRRPQRVMGILQKVDERGHVPSTSHMLAIAFTTEHPLRLSSISRFTRRVVDRRKGFQVIHLRNRITAVKRARGNRHGLTDGKRRWLSAKK